MNTTSPTASDFSVIAESAPIGVQLWPTRSPEYAPNFTLASVSVIRNETRPYVAWTYQSGNQRTFNLGEEVSCRVA